MIYKVGNTGDVIEIGQYRSVDKGALKGFFSLVIYSPDPFPKSDKMIDCRYFDNGTNRWFSFPSKEVKHDDKPTEYIPYRSFGDKIYFNELRAAILTAITEIKKEAPNENTTHKKRCDSFQSETSSDSGVAPF